MRNRDVQRQAVEFKRRLAVVWAALFLCCGLSVAVSLAATEALLRPDPRWWLSLWFAAWAVTTVALSCWVVLHTRKRTDARSSRGARSKASRRAVSSSL